MASTTCGHCGRVSHMTVVWAEHTRDPDTEQPLLQGAAKCDACGQISVGFEEFVFATRDAAYQFETSDYLVWFPKYFHWVSNADMPDHISRAATEAHRAATTNSPMSAVLMARTVVEAAAKSKGIIRGRLFEKIDAMAEQNLIRPDTKEAAHEIRHFGNDMAHGDLEDQPTAEEVADVLALMDEVLHEVFLGPARIARVRGRREQGGTDEAC